MLGGFVFKQYPVFKISAFELILILSLMRDLSEGKGLFSVTFLYLTFHSILS